jgi:hypothetical protein
VGHAKQELTTDALAWLFQQRRQARIIGFDDLFVWMTHGDFKSVIGYAPFSTPYSAGIST